MTKWKTLKIMILRYKTLQIWKKIQVFVLSYQNTVSKKKIIKKYFLTRKLWPIYWKSQNLKISKSQNLLWKSFMKIFYETKQKKWKTNIRLMRLKIYQNLKKNILFLRNFYSQIGWVFGELWSNYENLTWKSPPPYPPLKLKKLVSKGKSLSKHDFPD